MSNKPKQLEPCSICLEELVNQTIGIPEGCDHAFCFECLVTWAKKNKTCPYDRRNIQFILKQYSFFNGKPYAKVDINNTEKELPIDDSILCRACENDYQEFHPFVKCTQCKDSYHEFCVNTSDLSKWICPSCGYENNEQPEFVYQLPIIQREKPPSKNEERSVISPTEAARRIAASGKPISSSLPSRETILNSQAKYMTALRQKRKQFARLPPRIPVNQLPRIQRRHDAPIHSQSKVIQKKSTRFSSKTAFIDQLLDSQKQLLHSPNNIQLHRVHKKMS